MRWGFESCIRVARDLEEMVSSILHQRSLKTFLKLLHHSQAEISLVKIIWKLTYHYFSWWSSDFWNHKFTAGSDVLEKSIHSLKIHKFTSTEWIFRIFLKIHCWSEFIDLELIYEFFQKITPISEFMVSKITASPWKVVISEFSDNFN